MTGRRLSPSVFLLAAALALAPWIAWLAMSLPCHYQSRHWGIAWAGFDTGLALALGLTGVAALRRVSWLDRAAVATATLLVADAWFDIVTSRGPGAVMVAVAEALALELPIAVFCLWLARSTASPPHTGGPAVGDALRLGPTPSTPSGVGPAFNPKEQLTMNQCEVGIRGLDDVMSFAAARWELLTFPEVRDLLRGAGRDRFVVFYVGDEPDIDGWCGLLAEAGFPASWIGALGDTGRTA